MNCHVCILFSSTVMCGFYFSSTVTNGLDYYYLVIILMWFLCDKVCQWLAAGRRFFQETPVSSTNKTDRHETRSVQFYFNGNTSYLPTSTLNTKYIWAVLIKLYDSATYDDRRKSYKWLKHQALKCNFISLKVYFLRNQSYRDKSADQKQ